jgi:hypothetical protein
MPFVNPPLAELAAEFSIMLGFVGLTCFWQLAPVSRFTPARSTLIRRVVSFAPFAVCAFCFICTVHYLLLLFNVEGWHRYQ